MKHPNQQRIDQVHAYAAGHQEELLELIRTLCTIPAPSGSEEQRAAYIKQWLMKHGCVGATIDEVNNVTFVYPPQAATNQPMVAFLAHIDTVFPEATPLTLRQEGNRLYCPGVGDDTTNVAVLLLMARYFVQQQFSVSQPILFAFNSCEEGLGNLRGSKHIFERHEIDQMIALDGTYDGICNAAVGSLRYEVEVKTEGGHSYASFGNNNAITCLAQLIDDLYCLKVKPGTTYNVGGITGGTSINTIAQQASMLFEIRSDEKERMEQVRIYFEHMIQAHRSKGIEINVQLLGERPCMGDVNAMALDELTQRASDVIQKHTNRNPVRYAGSTDCNIPFSKGIVAICFGAYLGKGAHTKEEYIEIDSLQTGFAIVSEFMMHYANA